MNRVGRPKRSVSGACLRRSGEAPELGERDVGGDRAHPDEPARVTCGGLIQRGEARVELALQLAMRAPTVTADRGDDEDAALRAAHARARTMRSVSGGPEG